MYSPDVHLFLFRDFAPLPPSRGRGIYIFVLLIGGYALLAPACVLSPRQGDCQ